ncbi:shikimate dehydrogenase [Anaerocolumna aminovalerica]|uniref:shikimate dehydrogenase family protein n=1 Tax=Anaerocolumna aminovalerica TaxID=1527 RepID=UPI001C0F0352|nr:shikimate dehydrogenase [Anaerocolumna aminovalerica]MBU5332027.1 shikimate dehydrogenase [Anaerocolumna aminovalerica]
MEYGLIGEKLGHSYSKIIHEKLADYKYDLTPLTKEEFPLFMEKREFKAINVTIPYKEKVIPYLDEMDNNAKQIGAVNTVVNTNGKLVGHNTDFSGFLYMIQNNGVEIKDKKVLVLGNGGASKAVAAVLKFLEAKEIILAGRTLRENTITFQECYEKHTHGQVIVNATPVGMYPDIDETPIDLKQFTKCEAVLDLIYNPLKTKLLHQAEELGMKAVNGLEMLVAQAKYAVEFFLGNKIEDVRIKEVTDEIYSEILSR